MTDIEKIRTLYEQELLGVREVADRLSLRPWYVYRVMKEQGIARRRGAAQNFATYKHKPVFVVKSPLTEEEKRLRVAGVMLYWAEGVKAGVTVDLANSDPALIMVFLKFLRRICGVAESRLRVLLYAYADQDIPQLINFWSRATDIPARQFVRPYVRSLTVNRTQRKMPHGLVHIRYNDVRLLQLILEWTKTISQSWAGAGVANRISL